MEFFVLLICLLLASVPVSLAQSRTTAPDCSFSYNQACRVLAHQPFPSNYVCSQQGTLPQPDENLVVGTPCGTYDVMASDTNEFGSGNACGIGCFNNPKCITWSWDFDNSECRWYTEDLGRMAFNATPNGPYTIRYFNRHCLYENCTSPNVIKDGSFEKALPVKDDGSKKPDTWFYADTPGATPANCSSTSQSFIGAHGYKCHQDGQTHTIFQYPSGIQPNTSYNVSLRFGFVPGDYTYEGTPGSVFFCRVYGDGKLLQKAGFCQQDYEPQLCKLSDNFFGYSAILGKARWKSGPGLRGSHMIMLNCSAPYAWDTWVDDVEVRAV